MNLSFGISGSISVKQESWTQLLLILLFTNVLWSLNLAYERHSININVFQTVGSYTLNRIFTFQILGGESRKIGRSLKKEKKRWIQETRKGFGQEGREGRKRLHSRSRITRMLFGLEGWGLCFSKQTEGALYPQKQDSVMWSLDWGEKQG